MGRGRTPFSYHKAYCAGRLNELGYWVADGRSERAETELVERLGLLMIRRPREVIWANTPPKTRQVIRFDIPAQGDVNTLGKRMREESHFFKEMERLLPLYTDIICERLVENLINGEKDIIWVLTRQSVELMAEAVEKACTARDVAARMREVGCRIWATHGEADIKVRNDVARAYREHPGAGVIIATMDSLPESISLFGATTEHYAQLHFQSGPVEQSENRPYLKGTSKLHILYYVPRGTVLEKLEATIVERLITADKIGDSRDAAATAKVFEKKTETWDDFLARLTANVPDEGEIDLAGGGIVETEEMPEG